MKNSTRDRVNGKVREVKGALKKKVGRIISSPRLEAEGRAQQAAGKVQQKIGQIEKLVGK